MKSSFRWVIALGLALPAVASAGRIKLSGETASSTYPEENGISYDAGKIADSKASTAWIEGEQGSGLGAWINLDLGGEHNVQTLRLWAGYWYSGDFWKRANRPKEIELEYSDGSKGSATLTDQMTVQDVPVGKKTSSIKIKIKSVYDGTTWFDTPISEVQVVEAGDDAVAVRAFNASSTAPPDADGSYVAANVGDGLQDTMWCEGNKSGDGTNEWIELVFPGSKTVHKLNLVNGMGSSLAVWMKGNRATHATIQFSDGSSAPIEIKNSMLAQSIDVGSHTAESARITFDSVVRGKEFNDLCISEAYFTQ